MEISRASRFTTRLALAVLLSLAVWGCDTSGGELNEPSEKEKTGRDVLVSELNRLVAAYPGAVGVVRYRGHEDAIAARGVRRSGAAAVIRTTDRMHIGSITKSMTATMIACLVEDGLLHWDDHPGTVLGIEPAGIDPGYVDVTLLDLLHHRAGVPDDEDIEGFPEFPGDLLAQRRQAAELILAAEPAVAPGTFHYSNAGYTIAAAMAEAATGQAWEALFVNRLSTPLGLHPVFGWPATVEDPDQPWGHTSSGMGGWTGVDPTTSPALPEIINPAGNVSLTLSELGRYMDLHLQAERGAPHLLQAATFAQLHAPVGAEAYACGLEAVDLGLDGLLLWHDGSNTTFFSLMYILPEYDLAVAIIINAGEEGAADVNAAVEKVARWYMDLGVAAPASGG